MKEAFEKIIEQFKQRQGIAGRDKYESKSEIDRNYYQGVAYGFYKAIEIVNQVAEECNDGWIPCSERLPEEKGEYYVTYYPCHWGRVWDDEVCVGLDSFRGKSTWAKNKHQRVIAWKPKDVPYKPKGE